MMKQSWYLKPILIILISNRTVFGQHGFTRANYSIASIYPASQMLQLDVLQEEFSPFIWASDIITLICSFLFNSNNIFQTPPYQPTLQNLNFILHASNMTEFFPLSHVPALIESPYFDVRKKVVVFVTGWLQHPKNNSFVQDMARAFQTRGDYNFLVLDDADYLNTIVYPWAAINTDIIGQHVARALTALSNFLPVDNIHLIGHSLGAQVVGSVGRYFRTWNGRLLPHITGLDPAKPCFAMGGLKQLLRGNAQFIDILHTNPDVLGIGESVGDVDFYVDGQSELLADCIRPLCAHLRSITLYTHTIYVQFENNFLARCFTNGKCSTNSTIPMGFAVPKNATGSFIVD